MTYLSASMLTTCDSFVCEQIYVWIWVYACAVYSTNGWCTYDGWKHSFVLLTICNGALRCIVANNAYNSLCPNVSMRIILKRCINEMQEQRFSIVEPSTCRFLERMRERESFFPVKYPRSPNKTFQSNNKQTKENENSMVLANCESTSLKYVICKF